MSDKNDGVARTPPMGWRSWNFFGPHVNQTLMEDIMRAMVLVRRGDDDTGGGTLCDLGYCDVGLDDNWQDCDGPDAAPGMHYHDERGRSLVDTRRFPNLRAMTEHAHGLGLTAGWYHNNCICSDHCRNETECDLQTRMDARDIVQYGFDSVKLDGCGGQRNLGLFHSYLKAFKRPAERAVMIENCHWGRDGPSNYHNGEPCPYHFYRTSGDISATYQSVMHNLHTVEKFRARNQSTPGCWAYPDMLQVGVHKKGEPGLDEAETRSHFGAWAIVSSPLMLSHDVRNETLTDELWPLISNREALAVNQAYAGDSGGLYDWSEETVRLGEIYGWQAHPDIPNPPELVQVVVPAYQYLSKRLNDGSVAVLLMNSANETARLVASFPDVPDTPCTEECIVRNVWKRRTEGVFRKYWAVSVGPHDAAFAILKSVEERNDPGTPLLFVTPRIAASTVVLLLVVAGMRILRLQTAKLPRLKYSRCDAIE